MGRTPQSSDEQYSEPEAQRRFMAAIKAAVNTKPTPLKTIVPKGVPAQRKKNKSKNSAA
ncbi:MAG: hypothetical protein WCG92_14245 [Hyphomicrobiales bacterium]